MEWNSFSVKLQAEEVTTASNIYVGAFCENNDSR